MMRRYGRQNAPQKIMVASGEYVDPMNLQPEDVNFTDIAHALSNKCRFSGHTRRFYSVAEHSVRVSLLLHDPTTIEGVETSLAGLLHDSSEYVLVDLPRPLKHESALGPVYREAEERAERAIAEAFGLSWPWPAAVKKADAVLLATERRDLLPARDDDDDFNWLPEPPTRERIVTPMTPEQAKWEFTRRFTILTRRREQLLSEYGVESGEEAA